jgi:hypothetical protein
MKKQYVFRGVRDLPAAIAVLRQAKLKGAVWLELARDRRRPRPKFK